MVAIIALAGITLATSAGSSLRVVGVSASGGGGSGVGAGSGC
jgi:hypothetical protein